jgi:hypothetical protein
MAHTPRNAIAVKRFERLMTGTTPKTAGFGPYLIYSRLAMQGAENGNASRSIDALAAELDVSRNTIVKIVRRAHAAGLVFVQDGIVKLIEPSKRVRS